MTFIHESVGLSALGLLAVAVTGLVISWGTLLITRLFRRRSAPFREMILKGGTCLMLGWPVVVLMGVFIGSATRPVSKIVHVASVSEAPLTSSPSSGGRREQSQTVLAGHRRETVGTVWTPAADLVASTEKTIQKMLTEPSPEPGMSYTILSLPLLVEVAIIMWCLGLVVSLGFLLRDLFRVRRARQRLTPCFQEIAISALQQVRQSIGLKRTPDLLLSPDLTSPCTAGIRRPAIILPIGMLETTKDRESLLGVLTHEAAHVKRRDVAWSLLVRLARVVYWWEYGLSKIDRQLSQLREEICDNYVLLAPVDRRVYAKTLLDFAESWVMRPLVGVIGMMGKNNPLSNRIERLLAEGTQPHTRLSRWSWTGLACGGLAAVVTVGLLGVWAERAAAVDPLVVRMNLQDRIQTLGEATPAWSGESEVAPVPSWSVSSEVTNNRMSGKSKATSPPARSREAQAVKAAPEVPAEGAAVDTSLAEVHVLPSRKPSSSQRSVEPNFEESPPPQVGPGIPIGDMREPFDPNSAHSEVTTEKTLELDLPNDTRNLSGKSLSVMMVLPSTQTILPRSVLFSGFKVADPVMLPRTVPTPGDEAPVAEANAARLTLTGPTFSVTTIETLRESGAAVTVSINASEPTAPPASDSHLPNARYRLTLTAIADETGILKGFQSLGRDIPVTESGPIEAAKAFVANWKQQCIEPNAPDIRGRASWTERLIILNVPDTMRYGEVQKVAMACDSEDLQVEVRSGSSPAQTDTASKNYAAVELTRVYDKQGKPVGPGAILVAHKMGAKDMQIITDNHWDQALSQFAGRYAGGASVLLVNADTDLPLETLRDLQVRANRVGIGEVRFLTGAVPETLEIRSQERLVPLLDDLPVPNPLYAPGLDVFAPTRSELRKPI